MESLNSITLIAPCGMNCGICMAYLRDKNRCLGCRIDDSKKFKSREKCRIKNCEILKDGKANFCFECEGIPCERLKHLDKRYRTKYHMSMIENLEFIQKSGMESFIQNEKLRWTCQDCGGTICVHKGGCSDCGKMKFPS